jgi:hypothetical protein
VLATAWGRSSSLPRLRISSCRVHQTDGGVVSEVRDGSMTRRCVYCVNLRVAVVLVDDKPACRECQRVLVAKVGDLRIAPLASDRQRLGLSL